MADFDVIIVGAGHNGLVCAAYLAQAGLSVKVVERRSTVGGAAVTEEFHPGFRNSVAAYTVSLLQPKVIADLGLHRHGLRIVERRAQNFLPTLDGDYLLVQEGHTAREIAKFSASDAARYAAFNREIDAIADVLRLLVLQPPPNITTGLAAGGWKEAIRTLGIGNKLRRLAMRERRALLDLFTLSAGDYLDRWFDGALIKALFGFDAIVGNYASPYTPGTAYVMLHHAFGEGSAQLVNHTAVQQVQRLRCNGRLDASNTIGTHRGPVEIGQDRERLRSTLQHVYAPARPGMTARRSHQSIRPSFHRITGPELPPIQLAGNLVQRVAQRLRVEST